MKTHVTRHRLRAAVIALTAMIGTCNALSATAEPSDAGSTTTIRPATLERGDAGYVPHVDGDSLVVGDSRYDFGGREVSFLGYAGPGLSDYVVGVYREGRPRTEKVLRVKPNGDRSTVLAGVSPSELSLSSDGEHLFRSDYRPGQRKTAIQTWSTRTGDLVAAPVFRGYADVVDAFDGRAVVGAVTPDRTFSWDLATGDTERITRRTAYEASIRQNRLAVLTGDPYQDGCSVVSTLERPGDKLWRSCTQAVASFSPSGDRVLTTDLRADGLGPVEYQLREVDGRHARSFRASYFDQASWEADEVLLMHAHGKDKQSWVRCTDDGDCERTSKLRDNAA